MFRSILWCLMGFGVQYSQCSDTIMRVESCRDGEGIFFLTHCSDLYYGVQWGSFGVLPVSHSDAIATAFIGVLQTLTITAKPKTLHSQTLPLRQETPLSIKLHTLNPKSESLNPKLPRAPLIIYGPSRLQRRLQAERPVRTVAVLTPPWRGLWAGLGASVSAQNKRLHFERPSQRARGGLRVGNLCFSSSRRRRPRGPITRRQSISVCCKKQESPPLRGVWGVNPN